MAKLQPKDKVEWRAGARPSSIKVRKGVVKEIRTDGICLVRTRVEGAYIIEEIRAARLSKVEEDQPVKKKKAKKKKRKKRAASKKSKKE
ncbi:MAG: hypothetical protein P9M00_10960 [Candidatus Tritonobacter lacicola]|nr:hypothetical protein [Candidatus Tritonobacter lacicola]